MKERIYLFDNVKVWLMLMVVLGHTVIKSFGSSDIGVSYIWFFRGIYTMPLFFFISGFFTKLGVKISKLCKSILFPFLVFDIFYLFYEPLFNMNYTFRWYVPAFSMWFLWVLFFYRLLFPLIIKIKYIFPLSVLAALLVGFIPYSSDFALSRLFCFLPFYLLGYYVKNEKHLQFIKNSILQPFKTKDYIFFAVILIFWAIILYYKPTLAYNTTYNMSYGGNISLLVVRLLLYISACIIGFYVLKIFPNRVTFYTKYGERTMGVYLFHGVIILPFAYNVFQAFEFESPIGKFLMIIVPIAISLLLFSKPVDSLIKRIF